MEITGTKEELVLEYAHRLYPIGPTAEDTERARRAARRLTRKQLVEAATVLVAKGQ